MALSGQPSNFAHLRVHDEQLVRLGQLAERYFVEDPNTCLLKLRQLTELLAQLVASNVGLFTTPEEKQTDLLRRLQDQGIVPREVGNLFHEVRRAGNDANHKLAGDHRSGLLGLRLTWQLGVDSLGLDENNCPVILEYKRSVGENVINQGLFYLDWLMDHQAEFKLLVMDRLGKPAAAAIDWGAPRLVCVAADFTKYDGHAVQQINRNIELIRYRRFGEELLLLELANATSANAGRLASAKSAKTQRAQVSEPTAVKPGTTGDRSFAEWLPLLPPHLGELVASLDGHVLRGPSFRCCIEAAADL